MKVDELEGIQLDLWVDKSEGLNPKIVEGTGPHFYGSPMPSWIAHQEGAEIFIDWSFIGPIIAKIDTWLDPGSKTPSHTFLPQCKFDIELDIDGDIYPEYEASGTTIEEAIKRCIVKRKFGETVEVVTPRECLMKDFYEIGSFFAGGYWVDISWKHFELRIWKRPAKFSIVRWIVGIDEATFGGNVDDKFFKSEQDARDYAARTGIILDEDEGRLIGEPEYVEVESPAPPRNV